MIDRQPEAGDRQAEAGERQGEAGERQVQARERQVVVGADGRRKAYRPLPAATRIAAVVAGLEAYEAGDYFEAHELMEPAWMGTDDPAERALIQGLIKVAAADVHAVRGNPAGVRRNLEGARDRLRSGVSGSITGIEVEVSALIAAIEMRLAALDGAWADGPGADRPLTIDWRRR